MTAAADGSRADGPGCGGRHAPVPAPERPRRGAGAAEALSRATETLALTLWAEAGVRPVRAIEALAALAVNRTRLAASDPAFRLRFAPGAAVPEAGRCAASVWAMLLGHVCRAPFVFACWAPRHPMRAALAAGAAPPDDPALAICRRIAARAAAGALPDPTGGATHWHAADALPPWAVGKVPTEELCGLVLYRL